MPELSRWRVVWLLVMFDLPVKTRTDKTRYRHFHDFLVDDGFQMLQYSVYGRHCASREMALTHSDRVRRKLPRRGRVRVLHVTEAQFAKMQVFEDFTVGEPESPPQPLEFW
jgi:CRISPR-associated protein Cas2